MFNPKENLLDQQLIESGLELQLDVIDFVTGGAKSRNETARENAKAARKHQKKIANLTNKHNKKLDKADKENYRIQRNFAHDSNIRNWKRGKEIQDFQYLSQLQQFQKSQAIGNAQLGLNAEAMAQGIDAEKMLLKKLLFNNSLNMTHQCLPLKKHTLKVCLIGVSRMFN